MKKKYEYIITDGSCNGEEVQFKSYVEKQHPDWDVKVEYRMYDGLYIDNERDENFAMFDTLWDDYCGQPQQRKNRRCKP